MQLIRKVYLQIDAEALKSQVEEKRRLEQEQERINRVYEDELKKADQIAVALAQKEREVISQDYTVGITDILL